MCDEPDEYYDVQTDSFRKARKEHLCYACEETIRKGDVYRVTFAKMRYDSPETYKHCLRCVAIMNALHKALPGGAAVAWDLNCGEQWENTIGELPEDVAALAFLSRDDAQQRLTAK